MKTLGLITIHRIMNCGSVFQCLATYSFFKKHGFKVKVIDYCYPNEYHLQIAAKQSPYAQQIYSFIGRVRAHFYRNRMAAKNNNIKKQKRDDFLAKYIEFTKPYYTKEDLLNTPPVFDLYVTGSDQTWNPRYIYEDLSFFLQFAGDKPRIAFSASFGAQTLDDDYKRFVKPWLDKYDSISTRELSGTSLVKDITGKDAQWTCDPTLLLNKDEWSVFADKSPIVKGKYILCYILSYTSNPYPYADEFIKYIHQKLRMKVVCIDENGRYWHRYGYTGIQDVGPSDFLNLFLHASFVITSSFHGTAFSLNFKKDFYSIVRADINDERQYSLLENVGALDRLIKVGSPMPDEDKILMTNKDYVYDRMELFRSKTINYFSTIINTYK